MPSEHFNPGQTIFKEGEKSHDAYYLVHGAVEISVSTPHGQQVLGKIGPGEVFGEMGMIMDRPRSATATALEATLVESISEAEFESYFLQNPDRLHAYLSTLFERIRKTDLLLQISGHAPVPPPPRSTAKEPVYRVRITPREGGGKPTTITKLPFRIGRASFDTGVRCPDYAACSIVSRELVRRRTVSDPRGTDGLGQPVPATVYTLNSYGAEDFLYAPSMVSLEAASNGIICAYTQRAGGTYGIKMFAAAVA